MNIYTKPSDLSSGGQHVILEAIECLMRLAHNNAKTKGFWEDYEKALAVIDAHLNEAASDKYVLDTKLGKIALVQSELGEMTEGVRKPGPDQHLPEFTQEEVEAADAFIRLLDYSDKFGLRFAEAVLAKMEFNAGRPHMHGKGA